ncbi:hypothetical protein [Clostridium tertium]|uniref:hypothetical protein n=1 Tax=Clostridium tertium TaxID=1559 RepID=UPI0023B2F4C5|nr:hypothetical protein [Clostridium tertium]
MSEKIKKKVDELIKWNKLLKEATPEVNRLKADLLTIGIEDLENTKIKTVAYYGTDTNKVEVQETEKVDIVSASIVQDILGKAADEFITKEVVLKPTKKFMDLVSPLATGDYKEGNFKDYIATLTTDEKKLALLNKKLKGSFKLDMKNLMTILELNDEEAKKIAIDLTELANYRKIIELLDTVKGDRTVEELLDKLKSCVIAEENVKIIISYE